MVCRNQQRQEVPRTHILEPAGTNRVGSWANVDLFGAYVVLLGGRAKIAIEARVLNLFGEQTTTSLDQRKYLDARIRPATSAFAT